MKKYLLMFVLPVLLLIPSMNVSAYDFSYPEAPFYLEFGDEWRQFTSTGVSDLPLKDQENLRAAFFTLDKANFLYVKRYDANHNNWHIFQNAKTYVESTPKEIFKETRILKPLETVAGKKIDNFAYDFKNASLHYETVKIKSVNSKYKIIGLWKLQGEVIWEFQVVTHDLSKANEEKILLLLSDVSFESKQPVELIPQEDHTKTFLAFEKEETKLDNFMEFVLSQTFLIILFAFIGFLATLSLLLKFFRRN